MRCKAAVRLMLLAGGGARRSPTSVRLDECIPLLTSLLAKTGGPWNFLMAVGYKRIETVGQLIVNGSARN